MENDLSCGKCWLTVCQFSDERSKIQNIDLKHFSTKLFFFISNWKFKVKYHFEVSNIVFDQNVKAFHLNISDSKLEFFCLWKFSINLLFFFSILELKVILRCQYFPWKENSKKSFESSNGKLTLNHKLLGCLKISCCKCMETFDKHYFLMVIIVTSNRNTLKSLARTCVQTKKMYGCSWETTSCPISLVKKSGYRIKNSNFYQISITSCFQMGHILRF